MPFDLPMLFAFVSLYASQSNVLQKGALFASCNVL